ncbi:unnamed protein product [Acanthosepion pharaonis]|uniref:Uncharacterized protein n=1 Tax=Acanthosepion pharaonis TaxID=158019 RepID=A0A812CRE8_ACAPH|nr:unnamed protein product [Sepia pharaonis]
MSCDRSRPMGPSRASFLLPRTSRDRPRPMRLWSGVFPPPSCIRVTNCQIIFLSYIVFTFFFRRILLFLFLHLILKSFTWFSRFSYFSFPSSHRHSLSSTATTFLFLSLFFFLLHHHYHYHQHLLLLLLLLTFSFLLFPFLFFLVFLFFLLRSPVLLFSFLLFILPYFFFSF